jgi:hypothetical protein
MEQIFKKAIDVSLDGCRIILLCLDRLDPDKVITKGRKDFVNLLRVCDCITHGDRKLVKSGANYETQ